MAAASAGKPAGAPSTQRANEEGAGERKVIGFPVEGWRSVSAEAWR